MTSRLSSVLSPTDLPEAELYAARLDGEVFAVGACFSPVDEVVGPIHRARALATVLPPLMIAEQHTAAWVLGASSVPPSRPELCTDIGTRSRPTSVTRMAVREVMIDATEFVWMGEIRVTTPLRTTIDLARFSTEFDEREQAIVAKLADLGGFCLGDCIEAIDGRRNLPQKHRALSRLRLAFRMTTR